MKWNPQRGGVSFYMQNNNFEVAGYGTEVRLPRYCLEQRFSLVGWWIIDWIARPFPTIFKKKKKTILADGGGKNSCPTSLLQQPMGLLAQLNIISRCTALLLHGNWRYTPTLPLLHGLPANATRLVFHDMFLSKLGPFWRNCTEAHFSCTQTLLAARAPWRCFPSVWV